MKKGYVSDTCYVVSADKRPLAITVFFPRSLREDAISAAYQMLVACPGEILGKDGQTAVLYNNENSAVVIRAANSTMTINYSAPADKLKTSAVDRIVSLCGGAAYAL